MLTHLGIHTLRSDQGFFRECAGRIRSVSYIISHYNNTAYTAAADELDKILGVKHSAFRSVRCRQGCV